MKKFLSLMLIFAILFSFTACNGKESENPVEESENASSEQHTGIESNEVESVTNSVTTETESDTNSVIAETESDTESIVTDTEPSTDESVTELQPESESQKEPIINEKPKFSEYLKTLLNGYKWNPTSIIPTNMVPENEDNLVNVDHTDNDYSNFVPVSNILKNGIGPQWNMVMENISDAQMFFTALSIIDTISTVSVTAFNNYLDQNPADTAHYEFEHGDYSVTIHCTENSINYVLDYTTTVPELDAQSIQMALSMDLSTQVKTVRVQVGDSNALKYTVDQNKYTFALKYLGVKRAYFEITENADGTTTGHVYEYYKVLAAEIPSVADFYITDKYLTVVGNKAESALGMLGQTDTVCELYSVSNGKMIAYETNETSLTFGSDRNKLWFDLEDVLGITSIKFVEGEGLLANDKIYVNDKSDAWNDSKNFGIEFRTQYFYYYDSVEDQYAKIEAKVPMLFVTENALDDIADDINDKNDINIQINVTQTNISKLKSEYASKIDLIDENKDKYSIDAIIAFIGDKETF